MQCGQKNYQLMCSVWQCLRLCLYNTGISRAIVNVLSRDKTIQAVYQDKARLQLQFHRGITRLLLLSYAAGINEGKQVTQLAWIQVRAARDHPTAIPQSILIHGLCLFIHLSNQL